MSGPQLIAMLIGTILSLVGAIVFLYLRGERNHKKYHEVTNENLIKMTTALTESNIVIKNNTKAHERVFEYLVNGKKK